MRRLSLLLAVASSMTTPAYAQDQTAAPVPSAPMQKVEPAPVTPAMRTVTLDAGTVISISTVNELTSKKARKGDVFKIVTAVDVTKDGAVLIPHGTPGEGIVNYAKGTGAVGRSGTLQLNFTSLNLNGRTIMLNGQYQQDGNGNAGAMVGAAIAVGVFALFVTGHTAVITPKTIMQSRTLESQSFSVPGDVMTTPASAPAPMTPPAGAGPTQ